MKAKLILLLWEAAGYGLAWLVQPVSRFSRRATCAATDWSGWIARSPVCDITASRSQGRRCL